MPMSRIRPGLFLLVVIVCASASTACTHVRPWERGKLAHPTMTHAPGPAVEHTQAVQEGAVGGGGSAESGCGCN